MVQKINGYHGGFENDVNEQQLNKCSENEIHMEDFNLNKKASIQSDEGTLTYEMKQSQGVGIYIIDNTFACDCGLERAKEVQLLQPNVNLTGGFGWMGEEGCMIDNDSKLRENNLTNKKYINQFHNRPNAGYFGKGPFNVDLESDIRDSIIIKEKRACGPLSGSSTLEYTITPMIDRLEKEVQNIKHIIPEDSMGSWVRGGLPSREIVRNKEYMKRLSQN